MRTATILNLLGLIVGMAAAGLMYYFLPRVQQYTASGEPIVVWTSNSREEKKQLGKWQILLTRIGPALLGVAFLFQLIAVYLSDG